MALDKATVARIATLARIKVADQDLDRMVGELQTILNWVEELNTVNTDGVEPMTSVTPMAMKKREDKVTDGGIPDAVTGNAPMTEDHYFLVPKVVE